MSVVRNGISFCDGRLESLEEILKCRSGEASSRVEQPQDTRRQLTFGQVWAQFLVERQIIALEFDRIVFLDARHVLAMDGALNAGAPEQALALAAGMAHRD